MQLLCLQYLTSRRLLRLWHRFKPKMGASFSGRIAETSAGRRSTTANKTTRNSGTINVNISVRVSNHSPKQQPYGCRHIVWWCQLCDANVIFQATFLERLKICIDIHYYSPYQKRSFNWSGMILQKKKLKCKNKTNILDVYNN